MNFDVNRKIKCHNFDIEKTCIVTIFRKIIYIVITAAILVIGAAGIGVVVYKDKIIDLLKVEINKQIKTSLEVREIDLKLVKGFPNISIQFTDVRFHSAFEDELLLESKRVYFVLNLLDVFQEDITIERIEIEDAALIIHKNNQGKNNFDVFIKPQEENSETTNLGIESTKFTNIEILIIDDVRLTRNEFAVKKLNSKILLGDSNIELKIETEATLKASNRDYLYWAQNKKFDLKTDLSYTAKRVMFSKSQIKLGSSMLNFHGSVQLNEVNSMLLNLSGQNLKLSDVVTYLPKRVQDGIKPLKGKGLIGVELQMEGDLNGEIGPKLQSSFNLVDVEVNHSNLTHPIISDYLEGSLVLTDVKKLETGKIEIKDFHGLIDEKQISITGIINSLKNPNIIGNIKGELGVDLVTSLAVSDTVFQPNSSTGEISIDLDFNLSTSFANEVFAINSSNITGEIVLQDMGIKYPPLLPLGGVNGKATFNNNKLEFKGLTGEYGKSNFSIDGYLNTKGLFTSTGSIEAKLALNSTLIELDEIVESIIKLPVDSINSSKLRPKQYSIGLSVSAEKLNFKKLQGKNFKANTLINQGGITVNRGSIEAIGGDFDLSGNIASQFNGDYFIKAKLSTNAILLDSLFYIFDNFKQDFITSSAIKGELNSEVFTYMYFNENWKFKRNLLFAECALQVKKGELNNFEPIISLSSYLKNEDENLAEMRFSDIKSSVIISNDTVYISDMNIGSNVRNFKIGGYHTLDQHIDYRLAVPVIGNNDKDEAFGEVKVDRDGSVYMPFRIRGTTSDYKVNYDLKRAGANFFKGFKKELSNINSSIKRDSLTKNKQDTLLLEEDEFFDWDDN